MRGLIFGLLALTVAAAPARALERGEYAAFREWKVSVTDEGVCTLTREFANGIFLFTASTRNGASGYQVGLMHASWRSLPPGAAYPVKLAIDRDVWKRNGASAETFGDGGVRIFLGDDKAFLKAFSGGGHLDIVTADASYHVSLNGSSAASRMYFRCLKEQAAERRNDGNPFREQPDSLRAGNAFR